MGNRSSKNVQCTKNNQDEFFTVTSCNHQFEYQYLSDYITNKISSTIKCPLPQCSKNIPDAIIRKFLSNFKIELYESFLLLTASKQAKKCLTKDCPKIVIDDGENATFHCPYCDQPNCLKCNKRHLPSECKRGDITNENDIERAAIRAMSIHKRQEIESQFKEENYIPNPDCFECEICVRFILPREGLIMRNCFHNCCKICFEKVMKASDFQCLMCKKEVNDSELIKAVGFKEMLQVNYSMIRHMYFNCKYPDCSGFWDDNNCKGSYVCPNCHHSNCLECKDVHEGMSCESFKKTNQYKSREIEKEIIIKKNGVECICGKLLIREGGCGALYCINCHRHICAFTGKLAGNTGADSCGCTSTNPCHINCEYGCIAE